MQHTFKLHVITNDMVLQMISLLIQSIVDFNSIAYCMIKAALFSFSFECDLSIMKMWLMK